MESKNVSKPYQTVDEYLQANAPDQKVGKLGRHILANLILEGMYPPKEVLADILLLDTGKISSKELIKKTLEHFKA